MPDSQQPPFWGPPYDERDLDALLSGGRGSTPVALLPVESTLNALRAAPTGRELSDEAAARAAFRALAPPRVPWTAQAEHGTVTSHTLVLPPADGRPPRPARHRHRRRRRATWDARRSAIALTGAAAAAVIAVAVTGAIPGSIGNLVSFGHHHTSSASPTARTGQTPGALEGTAGAGEPTPSPEVAGTVPVGPSASATSATGTLCREFFEPDRQQSRATRHILIKDLERLAGNSMSQVFNYCVRYVDSSSYSRPPHPSMTFPTTFPTDFPPHPSGGYPGHPGTGGRGHPNGGNPNVGNRSSADQTPAAAGPTPGTVGQSSGGRPGGGPGQHGAAGLGGASGLGLLLGERFDDHRADILEGRPLSVAQPVKDESAHRCDVLWRGLADGIGPGAGERDEGAAAVGLALLPGYQLPAFHPGELMGQPALLPVERVADLERPQPLPRRLAQRDEHLVLGQGQPAVVLQLPVKGGGQQRTQPQVGTPGPLFVFAEPGPGHAASITRG